MSQGAPLELDGVACRYGAGPLVVHPTSLRLAPRERVCLLGPSGCGKTTLLRAIGGYLPVAAGEIRLAGRAVTRLGPEQRRVGMVFQNYALFPHLSARRNVGFGLDVRGVPRAERDRRVEAELRRVDLEPAAWDRKPRQLSGGQQQRVALARALAIDPALLLLDEPLANLDRGLREALRAELKQIQHAAGVASVWVTHDQDEALMLADRVGLMRAGRLVQLDRPAALYDRPRTPFVARFVGQANLLPIEARFEGGVTAGGLRWVCAEATGAAVGAAVGAAIGRPLLLRPEQLVIGEAAAACATRWAGVIEAVDYLGADARLTVVVTGAAGPVTLSVRTRSAALDGRGAGDPVEVGVATHTPWVIPDDDAPEADG